MDNPEEVLHSLDEFAKLKPKNIPRELEDYLMYVARTGDPVYQWPTVKILFREKLLNVITEFYESTPTVDLAPSPNVDPFNYENMKTVLLERLEAFSNAPFTVQRLCELLTTPRKEYNRPDKFMRAIEKNILVVSTREPGGLCRPDSALSEPIPNGVSEPPEAESNQSATNSNATNNEEDASPTSNTSSIEENHENQLMSETKQAEESNHVEPEPAVSSVKVTEDVEAGKQEEEPSESTVKDGGESSEATDSSDSLTFGDSNSAAEISDTINVTSTDCDSNTIVNDLLDQPALCVAESSEVQHVPIASSSSDVTSVGDAVLEAVPSDLLTELVNDEVSASENNSANKELEKISSAPTDENLVSSEAISEPSELIEGPSKPVEETESIAQVKEAEASEPIVSSAEHDQPADSTASEEKEAPSSDAVSSAYPSEIPEEVTDASTDKEAIPVSADIPEGSEAAPAVAKVENEAKKTVKALKSDADATITSSGNAERSRSGVEEAMDVDESNNQSSEASAVDTEAMEVAEDEEPMEVCEDNALEEMATSPSEAAQ